MKKFQPTESLFGVDPKTFKDKSYREALLIQKDSITRLLEELIEEAGSVPMEPQYYELYVGISQEIKKRKKALQLINERLEEIE